MSDRTPTDTKNLDGYGNPALSWDRVHGPLASGALNSHESVIGTVRPDGRPHAVRVGAIWMDGDIYFTSHEQSRKAKNLTGNPNCTMTVSLDGMDVSMEGTATRVVDSNVLERVAAIYRDDNGWPAQVEGDAITAPYSAPSAGPAPWNLYRFRYRTVFGLASSEPYGATRWRFSDS